MWLGSRLWWLSRPAIHGDYYTTSQGREIPRSWAFRNVTPRKSIKGTLPSSLVPTSLTSGSAPDGGIAFQLLFQGNGCQKEMRLLHRGVREIAQAVGEPQGTGQTLTSGGAILSSLKAAAGADEGAMGKGPCQHHCCKSRLPLGSSSP